MKKPEFLIVWSIMTAILLPTRMLMFQLFGNNSYGGLGVLTIISIIIVYLARQGKLGWFGRMFIRQITKLANGKRKYITFGCLGLNMFLIFTFILSVQYGEEHAKQIKQEIITQYTKSGKQLNMDAIAKDATKMITNTPLSYFKGIIIMWYLFIYHYPIFAANMSLVNDLSNNTYMHFATVVGLEQSELICIILFFKRLFKDQSIMSNSKMKG